MSTPCGLMSATCESLSTLPAVCHGDESAIGNGESAALFVCYHHTIMYHKMLNFVIHDSIV